MRGQVWYLAALIAAMCAVRGGLAAYGYLYPDQLMDSLGASIASNPQMPYIVRVWAIRDVVLALLVVLARPQTIRGLLIACIAIDATDIVSAHLAGAAGLFDAGDTWHLKLTAIAALVPESIALAILSWRDVFHRPSGAIYFVWHWLSSYLLTYWTRQRDARVQPTAIPAAQPLVLYEYNGCPFCQRVRAVITDLDLDVQVYPTPRVTIRAYAQLGDSRYRPVVKEKSGQLMFPYIEDPNTGMSLSDSSAIIAYLMQTYGGGARVRRFSSLSISTLMLRSLRLSLYFGVLRVPSRLPPKSLTFYGAQGSAGAIVVFDALTCLELPYQWRSCARGSRKRAELAEPFGAAAVLGLIDPNTGFVSASPFAIVRYLYATYQCGRMADETILSYSTDGATAQHGTSSSQV